MLALLGRECGWTRADLVEFTPHQLYDVVLEVLKQRQTEWRENAYPIAQLTAMTANIHRNPKKKKNAFKVEDFLPQEESVEQKKKRQAPEDMLVVARMWNAAFGGEVIEI